ncbi:MAG TPA: RNA polymerase sigma factor [Acidobacteriota bacterium]|nr:RNA polymerase sigma factor [Acidobacteriota bacterium]
MTAEQRINQMESLSDSEIMEKVKDGQVEKLAILFEKHHVKVFNFFLRLTGSHNLSEDLVQNVFVRILKYRSTYEARGKFVVWMFRIARNVHVDYLRKNKNHFDLDDQFEEPEGQDDSPVYAFEQKQDKELIQEALSRLPLKKREALILNRFQDMKYKEIAALFGCKEGTIKANIHRAVKQLGKIYFELQGGVQS